jgi:hypothetical protein
MTVSRVERKLNKAKRVAEFRNILNKEFIGTKKQDQTQEIMAAKARQLLADNRQEQFTVLEAIRQWQEKHPRINIITEGRSV